MSSILAGEYLTVEMLGPADVACSVVKDTAKDVFKVPGISLYSQKPCPTQPMDPDRFYLSFSQSRGQTMTAKSQKSSFGYLFLSADPLTFF